MSESSSYFSHEHDSFRTSRVYAIQPFIKASNLGEGVMATQDPNAISFITNLIRLWSLNRSDLPPDFVDEVVLTELSRQPLALVDLCVEVTKRELQLVREPYRGGTVDPTTWETKDLFKILPVFAGDFPNDVQVSIERVPGGEQLEECNACQSAGSVRCRSCEGGQVLCPECNGTREVACVRCLGMGRHFGTSGKLINCQLCRTRGYRRCNRCTSGTVACITCQGSGTLTCSTCEGHGNLLMRWQMNTSRRTHQFATASCEEPWSFDRTSIMGDSTEFYTTKWIWPASGEPLPELGKEIPPGVLECVTDIVRRRMLQFEMNALQGERVSAVRVVLRGVYAYSAEYQYGGSKERVFVSGLSNRVFSGRGKSGRLGIVNGLRRLGYNIVSALGNFSPAVDRKYLTSVQEGRVHIGDTRCLLPEVADKLSLNFEITEPGYTLSAATDPNSSIKIAFEYNSAGQALICISYAICRADRQRYQQALQFNARLSFGRISISPESEDPFFAIVDRRLYQFVSSSHLAKIIKAIMVESQKIIEGKYLN